MTGLEPPPKDTEQRPAVQLAAGTLLPSLRPSGSPHPPNLIAPGSKVRAAHASPPRAVWSRVVQAAEGRRCAVHHHPPACSPCNLPHTLGSSPHAFRSSIATMSAMDVDVSASEVAKDKKPRFEVKKVGVPAC